MALTGILADITQEKVSAPLNQREPEILTSAEPEQVQRFEDMVRSAAVEVVLLTGPNPPTGPIRDLAVEAIALQTASAIEYSEFPEQQVAGDEGRGYYLHQRYLELLAQLRTIIANAGGQVPPDGGAGGVANNKRPRGRFPAPMPYPDPIIVRGRVSDRQC